MGGLSQLRRITFLCALALVWLASQPAVLAQSQAGASGPGSTEALAAAQQLVQEERWQEAAEALAAVVEAQPQQAVAWYHLGFARSHLGQHDAAAEALETSETLGVPVASTAYRLAAVRLGQGRRDDAFAELDRALAAGFTAVAVLEADEALAALRPDPRVAAAVEKAKRNGAPCQYDEVRRQFDFWLGEWDVQSPAGPAGNNTISAGLKGCLLTEAWTSVSGSTGTSMNFVDPRTGKWRQLWVDSGGGVIEVEGGLREDGSIHFEGEHGYPGGRIALYRMTFTPLEEGKVRQYIEESSDGGESWAVWFDGTYVPRRPAGATD